MSKHMVGGGTWRLNGSLGVRLVVPPRPWRCGRRDRVQMHRRGRCQSTRSSRRDGCAVVAAIVCRSIGVADVRAHDRGAGTGALWSLRWCADASVWPTSEHTIGAPRRCAVVAAMVCRCIGAADVSAHDRRAAPAPRPRRGRGHRDRAPRPRRGRRARAPGGRAPRPRRVRRARAGPAAPRATPYDGNGLATMKKIATRTSSPLSISTRITDRNCASYSPLSSPVPSAPRSRSASSVSLRARGVK